MAGTTIWISQEMKAQLDARKEHVRETYGDVIARMMKEADRARPKAKARKS